MRAAEVLQTCPRDALGSMHALRSRALLRAVEAMIHGKRKKRAPHVVCFLEIHDSRALSFASADCVRQPTIAGAS
jgi:hypothetical protein